MLSLGKNGISKAYLGNRPVKQMWLNGKLVWQKLPYDAEVEYIESTGTQWIDTGITPYTNSTVMFDALIGVSTSTGYRRFLYSDQNPNVSHYSDISGMKYGSYGAYCNVSLEKNVLYKSKSTFESTKVTHEIYVNEQVFSITSSSYSSGNWGRLILFRLGSSYTGSNQRLGHIAITVNDVLVCDFIPVRFTNENN